MTSTYALTHTRPPQPPAQLLVHRAPRGTPRAYPVCLVHSEKHDLVQVSKNELELVLVVEVGGKEGNSRGHPYHVTPQSLEVVVWDVCLPSGHLWMERGNTSTVLCAIELFTHVTYIHRGGVVGWSGMVLTVLERKRIHDTLLQCVQSQSRGWGSREVSQLVQAGKLVLYAIQIAMNIIMTDSSARLNLKSSSSLPAPSENMKPMKGFSRGFPCFCLIRWKFFPF